MTDDFGPREGSIVLVVDDEPSMRGALAFLLTSAGYAVETFAGATELLAYDSLSAAGCLLLDLHLPGTSGLELHDLLRSMGVETTTIFISGRADVASSIRAMKGGAIDFLTKPIERAELLAAVERALERDRRRRADVAELNALRRRAARLTARELQVCALVASGRLNKQIAAMIGTSEKTVKVHRARVLAKLEIETLPELVRIADRLGIKYRPESSIIADIPQTRLSPP